MKKEMETTKDATSNLFTETKTDETTEVKRSPAQDFISEEKEVRVSKLTQDVDAATETTNGDNDTSSMAGKEEDHTGLKHKQETLIKCLHICWSSLMTNTRMQCH